MNIFQRKKTIQGTRDENAFFRKLLYAMVAINAVLVIGLFSRDTVVAITPPGMVEEGWLDSNSASDSYSEAWALYVASVVGNVKPATAGMIRQTLEPLLDESIYQDVINVVESQVAQIRRDRVVLAFEPKEVLREKDNPHKFFVVGRSVMTGPNNRPKRTNVTYEVELRIKNYRPIITFIDTYTGSPKTSDVVRREEQASKAKARMDKANEAK
ncbi:TraE/TraK family type IV conjugative transfer system protein [Pseudomonas aeruginosa]